jgi:nitrile hydratase
MTGFRVGESVRVRSQETLSHSRVPAYIQGHTGVIERVLSDFVIPEDDAWGRLWKDGRRETLYRVQFHQVDVWPGYQGPSADTNEIEMFENWLEQAEEDAT